MKKTKNYYRNEIAESSKKNKNTYALKELSKIADLFYRAYDEELYKTVTEDECRQLHCIRAILSIENSKNLQSAETLMRVIERRAAK